MVPFTHLRFNIFHCNTTFIYASYLILKMLFIVGQVVSNVLLKWWLFHRFPLFHLDSHICSRYGQNSVCFLFQFPSNIHSCHLPQPAQRPHLKGRHFARDDFICNIMIWVWCDSHFILINCWRVGSELSRLNEVNIMVDDALTPCVARSWAPMILTKYDG